MNESNYIYGRNAVLEAINSGQNIEKIFISFTAKGAAVTAIYTAAKKNSIPLVRYDRKKFDRLERDALPREANSQGVIALAGQIEYTPIDDMIRKAYERSEHPVIVVLDGINDPHNLGAIARSAECSGAAGMVLPERNSAPVSPAAVKASAGALEHLPVAREGNLGVALDRLKEAGFWIVGSDISGDKYYYEMDYKMPVALITGSEGRGMRPSIANRCDFLIKIPMRGEIESLNASVATGVILFEILRSRQSD
ncbi:MAG: 23S rRNA (guanosine(2251)-2'-O)-methyltransferase RlmB [Candidatus Kapaibacterium sp.]